MSMVNRYVLPIASENESKKKRPNLCNIPVFLRDLEIFRHECGEYKP